MYCLLSALCDCVLTPYLFLYQNSHCLSFTIAAIANYTAYTYATIICLYNIGWCLGFMYTIATYDWTRCCHSSVVVLLLTTKQAIKMLFRQAITDQFAHTLPPWEQLSQAITSYHSDYWKFKKSDKYSIIIQIKIQI